MYNLASWHLKHTNYIKKNNNKKIIINNNWIEIRLQSVLQPQEIYHYYSFGTATQFRCS